MRPQRQRRTSGTDTRCDAERRGDHLSGIPGVRRVRRVSRFLVRVDGPSALGAWSYEPWDTKLARHPKPYFLVQLCCYAEMLERVQGVRPRALQVVLGGAELIPTPFRTEDFFYYYRAVKETFLDQQRTFHPEQRPEIPSLADLGRWSGFAERELTARDDLALVADIRVSQIRKLRAAGIDTGAELAAAEGVHIPKLNDATFQKLRRQASLQITSRGLPVPVYEMLPQDVGGGLGLASLPPPCDADVFFDMEGFPLIDDGREYLFGACYRESGELRFSDWWAHSPAEEKRAFESFVLWAYARWRDNPGLHIYHYNHYEVTALRRLMGKYGVCEQEVDDLLRGEVFVDLYRVVRQSVMIGEPSYSLKYVEHLYRGRREGDVASAGESMVYYQRWLVAQDGKTPEDSAILKQIRDYNEQDCQSTAELAAWLWERQAEAGVRGRRESEACGDNAAAHAETQQRHALAVELLAGLPDQRPAGEEGERERVTELIAHLVEFHRREEKPVWWRRFDRMEMQEQELVDDPECLGGLIRTARPPERVKRSWAYEYLFDPRQETKLRPDDDFLFAHDWKRGGTILELDLDSGRAVLKLSRDAPPERLSITPNEPTLGKLLAPAVERVARRWQGTGRMPGAIEDLLFRRRPRLLHNPEGDIIPARCDALEGAIHAVEDMRGTTLCVQGPPGSGKTYTGARMIAALLRAGKRVGITSNSHRAVNLLLAEAITAATEGGVRVDAVKVGRGDKEMVGLTGGFPQVSSGKELWANGSLPHLIGGTAFPFAMEAAEATLDYLFVDEAGQVSLANLVAVGASAKNLVLLGDQMQLGQPIQGSHPGESGLSALDYLLQGRATIPEDFGIFLSRTWRLHPDLCRFISGAVYEDRLVPEARTADRILILGPSAPAWLERPAGLIYVPVEHDGNTYESPEEEDRIADLVSDLLRVGIQDGDCTRRLEARDILVIAPYNLQVRRLTRRLPGVRVGTVDKFQGQEAPVVIFSMCASSGDGSPRGIEFLFSRNRLNVAISRAQCLAIIVASPALVRTRCSSLEQMRLVNVYCRAVAEATSASLAMAEAM
jgi:predicted RecB family nuclease